MCKLDRVERKRIWDALPEILGIALRGLDKPYDWYREGGRCNDGAVSFVLRSLSAYSICSLFSVSNPLRCTIKILSARGSRRLTSRRHFCRRLSLQMTAYIELSRVSTKRLRLLCSTMRAVS